MTKRLKSVLAVCSLAEELVNSSQAAEQQAATSRDVAGLKGELLQVSLSLYAIIGPDGRGQMTVYLAVATLLPLEERVQSVAFLSEIATNIVLYIRVDTSYIPSLE